MSQLYKNELGKIDFFKELQTFELTSDEDKTCLISGMKLDAENSIELECGHQFNYVPLYNEVVKSKSQNGLDIRKLNVDEVRCPYCRHIQHNLLPFKPAMRLKRVHGVNWIHVDNCFNIPNINVTLKFDGKCHHMKCLGKTYSILITSDSSVDKLNRVYCYEHFKQSYKSYKKTIEKSVGQTHLPSDSGDILALLTELNDDTPNVDIPAMNVVISTSKCKATYKSGVNAGKPCTANAKNGTTYCGRHASQCTIVVD